MDLQEIKDKLNNAKTEEEKLEARKAFWREEYKSLPVLVTSQLIIPYITVIMLGKPDVRILDVGCGDGSLMKHLQRVFPSAKVIGIDIDPKAVKKCRDDGLTVYECSWQDYPYSSDTYDCIIFSMVLHEMYSLDKKHPFTLQPVHDALEMAYDYLEPTGKIVICDNIYSSCQLNQMFKMNIEDFDMELLDKFLKEYPMITGPVYRSKDGWVEMPMSLAKEFLYTYALDDEEWNANIKQRHGFASMNEINKMLTASSFLVEAEMAFADGYAEALSLKVGPSPKLLKLFQESTCIFVARKDESHILSQR